MTKISKKPKVSDQITYKNGGVMTKTKLEQDIEKAFEKICKEPEETPVQKCGNLREATEKMAEQGVPFTELKVLLPSIRRRS